jgi:hypothetical protein
MATPSDNSAPGPEDQPPASGDSVASRPRRSFLRNAGLAALAAGAAASLPQVEARLPPKGAGAKTPSPQAETGGMGT